MNLFKPDVNKLKEKNDVCGLVKALRNSDRDVRLEACWALGGLDDKRAPEALFSAIKDKDDLVPLHVAQTLAAYGDPRAADTLMELVNADWLGNSRSETVKALHKLNDPRASGVLRKACLRLLQDPDYVVREEAVKILDDIGIPEDPAERA